MLLAMTSGDLEDPIRLASEKKASVWCGAEAVSEAEYQTGSYPGRSRFIISDVKGRNTLAPWLSTS